MSSSMRNEPNFFQKKGHSSLNSLLPFGVMLFVVVIGGLYYCLSGSAMVVESHDQLDGEIFTYILHLQHFGDSTYPELMDGISSTGMQMAAPGMLLFYILLPVKMAFAAGYFFVAVCAYIGLFLLLKSFSVRQWLGAIVAALFAFLPFYSVYGLSIMGIPLLFWSLRYHWCLPTAKRLVVVIAVSFFYATFSSLVLVGYAVLLVVFGFFVYALLTHAEKRRVYGALVMFFVLLISYIATNYDLVLQTLLGAGYVSHKSEYELTPVPFSIKDVIQFICGGQQHAISNQIAIVPIVVMGIAAGVYLLVNSNKQARVFDSESKEFCDPLSVACVQSKAKEKRTTITMDMQSRMLTFGLIALFLGIVFIAIFYSLFHSEVGTAIRGNLPGSLKAFQFDRLYWLYPSMWYMALGLAGELLLRLKGSTVLRALLSAITILAIVLTAGKSYMSNDIVATFEQQSNIQLPLVQQKVTWDQFFGTSLFEQIEDSIPIDDPDNKVVSIGLYPSIALYNGCYCLDGYSNNYPLTYKHQFQRIIQHELNMSPELAQYFEGWGNRCYIFSHELGKNYFFTNGSNIVLHDLNIDTRALRELGGRYILSSVPIENYMQLDLTERGLFSDSDTPYSVWVYEINY